MYVNVGKYASPMDPMGYTYVVPIEYSISFQVCHSPLAMATIDVIVSFS